MNDVARKTILVIDDDDDFRYLLRLCSNVQNMDMLEASNGRDGIVVAQRERARLDAILVDYFMPGTDPVVCVAHLKEVASGRIPVVLVTAAADVKLRAAEVGLDRWLSKPFNVHALRKLLFD